MTLNRSSLPIEIQKLIIAFSSLPGIGPKTAQRLTFYVLSQSFARFCFDFTSQIRSMVCGVDSNPQLQKLPPEKRILSRIDKKLLQFKI